MTGRFYPLESMLFLLKGRPPLALRRFRRPCLVVVEGVEVEVFYHSTRTIQKALGPAFRLIKLQGLRSLRPVPGLQHLERFAIFRLLAPVDRLVCSMRLTATLADHTVSVWQYRT
jgi:hypothetical protein